MLRNGRTHSEGSNFVVESYKRVTTLSQSQRVSLALKTISDFCTHTSSKLAFDRSRGNVTRDVSTGDKAVVRRPLPRKSLGWDHHGTFQISNLNSVSASVATDALS